LKTDYLDLWQMHAIQSREDIEAVLKPGGAMEGAAPPAVSRELASLSFTRLLTP